MSKKLVVEALPPDVDGGEISAHLFRVTLGDDAGRGYATVRVGRGWRDASVVGENTTGVSGSVLEQLALLVHDNEVL